MHLQGLPHYGMLDMQLVVSQPILRRRLFRICMVRHHNHNSCTLRNYSNTKAICLWER